MDVLSCSYDLRFSNLPFSCGSPRSHPGYFRSHVFLDFGSQILSGSILFSLLFTTFPTVSCCLVCIFLSLAVIAFHTTATFCIMYNGVIPTLTGSKLGRFAKRGVSGLLSFAGERGSFIGFGRFKLFLTYLIASHERIFSFFLACVRSVPPTSAYMRTCSDSAFGLFAVISQSSIHGEWPVMNSKRTNTGYRFAMLLQKEKP